MSNSVSEQLRLINEIKKEVIDDLVLNTVTIDNKVVGTISIIERPELLDKIIILRFSLNGKEYIVRDKQLEIDVDGRLSIKKKAAAALLKRLSEKILDSLIERYIIQGK